ncbi:MAG TPA: hypothetical protein VGY54_19595 [Polyangiaceae bacterium]|nr:hypothetical protein [Polyangiaceae bacterium]
MHLLGLDRTFVALLAMSMSSSGCGAHALRPEPRAAEVPIGMSTRSTGDARPPVTVIAREGDALGAIAVAVATDGVAAERGALVGVALGALVEKRLSLHGVEALTVGGWNGWRLRTLVASPTEAVAVVDAIRAALLTPVAADEPALIEVARKVAALAARPLASSALVDLARCTGEAYGSSADATPTAAELESWRASSHGLGRVAVATTGGEDIAEAAVRALRRGPPWARGAAISPSERPSQDARAVVYDASGEIAPGTARIAVTARTATAERSVAAASSVGDARGPLASRLNALASPAHLRSVLATANRDGGCLAATIDLAASDLTSDAAARIATAASLARQEIAVEIADVTPDPDLGRLVAARAADPRDAAERAAWWSLAGRRDGQSDTDVRINLIVGVAAPRDASASAGIGRADEIRGEIDRATLAWHASVVDARTRVEHGQGDVWLLLASPCGTLPEGAGDAGVGAAVAMSAAAQAAQGTRDVEIEPFSATDGIGLLVHGARRSGETPIAQARRLADVAARAFAADAIEGSHISPARSALFLHGSEDDARALAALANALALGHPSWVLPSGTLSGLSSISDEVIALRAAAIRAGPMRVAVLANVDAAQADAAVRSVDRWIARRPGESRSCPPVPALATPRAGTYSVERPTGAPSEALLAIPLAPGDRESLGSAVWLAAVLQGSDGLLARALGPSSEGAGPSLASAWNAAVVGAPYAPALVVRIVASDAALDQAVAQTRALLDRLRQGALSEGDRARAAAWMAKTNLAASLDPRARTVDLWRGEPPSSAPSLQALRAFAEAVLHDDGLIIVAARPRMPLPRAAGARETKARGRE